MVLVYVKLFVETASLLEVKSVMITTHSLEMDAHRTVFSKTFTFVKEVQALAILAFSTVLCALITYLVSPVTLYHNSTLLSPSAQLTVLL